MNKTETVAVDEYECRVCDQTVPCYLVLPPASNPPTTCIYQGNFATLKAKWEKVG